MERSRMETFFRDYIPGAVPIGGINAGRDQAGGIIVEVAPSHNQRPALPL